ncbi:phenol hydroxylase [Sphingomonas sp. C3-2]|uniref:phenol hydroxylase n=1 Tax=Sphingomonas sp. C3-2 TaxID=3062169 RepID=UPI00294B5AA6|nr:phenol hydroxylase [Sphingomonas sp. C3-2]WOK35818.1 phenol hydroxylase [Sphingomonas sp. C3-2]
MNIDIQAEAITPRRHTFSHVARRFGTDKPATRYEEATYDIQPTTNFHYRPTYAPEFDLYDPKRTRIVMADWYSFKDPRQFYYATYNISRAGMQQSFDSALDFVEKRDMLTGLDEAERGRLAFYLIPLRHLEWAANMNCQLIADWGYGTQITSAAAFCGADRLGLAQLLSRIGLAMGGGGDSVLMASKTLWTDAPEWQPLRCLAEDSLVIRDWFETFFAQYVFDGLVYPLTYDVFDKHAPPAISLVTGFMRDWYADNSRWTDAVIKAAAAESDANRAVLHQWAARWMLRTTEAMRPLAEHVLGEDAHQAVHDVEHALWARLAKLGVVATEEVPA